MNEWMMDRSRYFKVQICVHRIHSLCSKIIWSLYFTEIHVYIYVLMLRYSMRGIHCDWHIFVYIFPWQTGDFILCCVGTSKCHDLTVQNLLLLAPLFRGLRAIDRSLLLFMFCTICIFDVIWAKPSNSCFESNCLHFIILLHWYIRETFQQYDWNNVKGVLMYKGE